MTNTPLDRFAALVREPDDGIDLGLGAALIAASEYQDLDVEREMGLLDDLASAIEPRLRDGSDTLRTLNDLSRFLFDDLGFQGNSDDYYNPLNSFLNDVLKRRLGIPISLALIYIEVGRRLGVPLLGIGMPGHFLVRHRDEQDLYVDTFSGGVLLSSEECAEGFRQRGMANSWRQEYLAPVRRKEFLGRMLRNLKYVYAEQGEDGKAIRTVNWLLALYPEAGEEFRDRGLLNYRQGHYEAARGDLNRYLDLGGGVQDATSVRQMLLRIDELLAG